MPTKSQPKVTRVSILNAIETLLSHPDARQTVVFQHPNLTVKATRQRNPNGRTNGQTFIVSIGAPAIRERQFISQCQKAGEPFPVKRVGIRWYRSIKP